MGKEDASQGASCLCLGVLGHVDVCIEKTVLRDKQCGLRISVFGACKY